MNSMDHLVHDSRLVVRGLRRSAGFTAAALITLALGIGANTATFSAINKLILRPLPVDRPAELVYLNTKNGNNLSYPTYKDIRDRTRSLSGLIAYRPAPVSLSLGSANAHLFGYEVTGNYFEVLDEAAMNSSRKFVPKRWSDIDWWGFNEAAMNSSRK
jgi:hypothetical protein